MMMPATMEASRMVSPSTVLRSAVATATRRAVKAAVRRVDALSGHADRHEIDRWLGGMPAPRRTFLVHGEPPAARGMAAFLAERRGWQVQVPAIGDTFEMES